MYVDKVMKNGGKNKSVAFIILFSVLSYIKNSNYARNSRNCESQVCKK